MKYPAQLSLITLALLYSSPLFALNAINNAAVSQNVYVIQDNVTPGGQTLFLNPTDAGLPVAQVDAKFEGKVINGNATVSVGGKKSTSILSSGHYRIAMWAEGLLPAPFLGHFCASGVNCSNNVRNPADTIVEPNGFKMDSLQAVDGTTAYGLFAKASNGLINNFIGLPNNGSLTYTQHRCSTQTPGPTPCKDVAPQTGSRWDITPVTLYKRATATLTRSTFGGNTIIVDSTGDMRSLHSNNNCRASSFTDGYLFSCTFISESTIGLSRGNEWEQMRLKLVPKNPALLTQIGGNQIWYRVHGDGTGSPYAHQTVSPLIPPSYEPTGRWISITKAGMAQLIRNGFGGPGATKLSDLFSIQVFDTRNPDLALTFDMGVDVTFVTRQPYLSIRSKDGALHPYRSGKVGQAQPLTFDYTIEEIAASKAQSLTVTLQQDIGTPHNGLCTFYPESQQQRDAVAIPTYLSMLNTSNQQVSTPIGCNNVPVDLRQLSIKESSSVSTGSGTTMLTARVYDLALNFDLKAPSVYKTISDEVWAGEVHQSGTITVKAEWL